jgi:hypothetical protein
MLAIRLIPPCSAVSSRLLEPSAMALLLVLALEPGTTNNGTSGPRPPALLERNPFLLSFNQDRKPGPDTNEVKRTAGCRRRVPASEMHQPAVLTACTNLQLSPDFPCGREQRQAADRGSRVVPPFCLPCGAAPCCWGVRRLIAGGCREGVISLASIVRLPFSGRKDGWPGKRFRLLSASSQRNGSCRIAMCHALRPGD